MSSSRVKGLRHTNVACAEERRCRLHQRYGKWCKYFPLCCKAVVPKLKSRRKSGLGEFDVRPPNGIMENLIIIEKTNLYVNLNNDPEYIIIECVFINFKHIREIKIYITNEHT